MNCIFITKGAPESVLQRCTNIETEGKSEEINSLQNSIDAKIADLSRAGYRILAVAYKIVDDKASYSVEDESDLTLLGFLVFTDPKKSDAQQAIVKLKEMGVDVKILTGDNELVARKICEEVDVPVKRIITGLRISLR